MVGKRTLVFATLAILVWAGLATILLGHYYLRFQEFANLSREYEAVTMKVNIYFDYGNGTKVWHNNTFVPVGFTLLNATELIADVYVDYTYGAASINAIDGVASSLEEKKYWAWWRWDTTIPGWISGEAGADQHLLSPGETLAWTYQSYETWPPPSPS